MSEQFRGFDDTFLLQFQLMQENIADELRRRAVVAQQSADAARRELDRRAREAQDAAA